MESGLLGQWGKEGSAHKANFFPLRGLLYKLFKYSSHAKDIIRNYKTV
jgi:hypothetical protein